MACMPFLRPPLKSLLCILPPAVSQLSAEEMDFLTKNNSAAMDEFEKVTSDLSTKAVIAAGSQVKSATK